MTALQQQVFLRYTQRELDDAYDQAVWAPNAAEVVARFTSESARLRPLTGVKVIRYGSGSDEALDFFSVDDRRRPLQVFVHGGAWRSGSKDMYAFVGRALNRHGIHCAVLDFSPIQEVGLSGMLDQVARALVFLYAAADDLNVDPSAITIMGHSSGAHLAACILAGGAGERASAGLQSAFLLSGIYDLEPVLLSSRRTYMKVSEEASARLSPQRHIERIATPVAVAYGAHESPEFKRQGREFAGALNRTGRLRKEVELSERNHFEPLLDLLEAGETLQLALDVAAVPDGARVDT